MDEPNALLRWVMFHFAGGDALFVALLVMALISDLKTFAWRWTLVAVLALIWGTLASPAWPLGVLVLFGAAVLGWRLMVHTVHVDSPWIPRATRSIRMLCLIAAVSELCVAWNFNRPPPPMRLCVIADSVTAGLNDGEFTWPQRFAQDTGVTVRDASQPGDVFRSALKQAEALNDDQSPLVLEIGGNDLLSGKPLAEFTRDCELLCQKVCTPGRVVWMCELPLPPVSSQYGCVQRRICRQHGIRLISKRKFMRILTTAGATVDSIHLSSTGQQLFCEFIRREIGCRNQSGSAGEYLKCEP